MEKIAFVDICGTLYRSNTTMDFLSRKSAWFARFRRNLPVRLFSKFSRSVFSYDYIRVKGVKELNGMTKVALQQEAKDFYTSFLEERKLEETHALIDSLRKDGYKIILISATLDFLAAHIAEKVHADAVYATTLDYADDVCNGIIGQDLLGRKHFLAERLVRELSGSEDIVVVTDDRTDLLLARMANRVVVVTPQGGDDFWKERLGKNVRFIMK